MGGVIGGNAISPNFGNGGGAELFSERFEVTQTDPLVIPLGTEESNAIQLLLLKLTKTVGQLDNRTAIIGDNITSEMRRNSGAGIVFIQIQESPDQITWNQIDSQASNDAVFREVQTNSGGFSTNENVQFIRFSLFNTNATTEGEIQFLKMYMEIIIPEGYTIERLI